MQTPPSQSSVLGKRTHQVDSLSSSDVSRCDPSLTFSRLLTPDSIPSLKRPRVNGTLLDGDGNKENIPPFRIDAINVQRLSPSTPRTLRRTSTELASSPIGASSTRRDRTTSLFAEPRTPTSGISCEAIKTPPFTPPSSLLPIHARARALLRSTCDGLPYLAGREQERKVIAEFISLFFDGSVSLENCNATTLYVSGSPGTGKTALVNSILSSITKEKKRNPRTIFINCMALNDMDALWRRLTEELHMLGRSSWSIGKLTKLKGKEALEESIARMQHKCLLVLDELDHVATSFESLRSLLSLSATHSSMLRILGIANTHTLTSSLLQCPASDIAHIKTLHFTPYIPSQLLEIVQKRLIPLYDTHGNADDIDHPQRFLPIATLTFLTKKIAAQTGDVRVLFEVLRGAINLAVASNLSKPSDPETNPLAAPTPTVTPTHVLSALKAYVPVSGSSGSTLQAVNSAVSTVVVDNEVVSKIHSLGLQARLVLLSVLMASKRLAAGLSLCNSSVVSSPTKSPSKRSLLNNSTSTSTAKGVDGTQLHTYYTTILSRAENDIFTPVSRSEFADLLGIIETAGLVILSSCNSSGSSPPSKSGRRAASRSSFGGVSKTSGSTSQDVRLADHVRMDEVLKGLGIMNDGVGSVRDEEVRAIWERERVRLGRDIKVTTKAIVVEAMPFIDVVED